MNVRVARGSLRVRIDERDMALLVAGKPAVVSLSAPGPRGALKSFACTLSVEDVENASATLETSGVHVRLRKADLDALRRTEEEGVAFLQPAGEGGADELVVNVEKDRRAFRPRFAP